MLKRSILAKVQHMRIDVGFVDEEKGEFFTTRSQGLALRFAVSKDHDCGFLNHFNNVPVIVRAYQVRDFLSCLFTTTNRLTKITAGYNYRAREVTATQDPSCAPVRRPETPPQALGS
jgi:hypothetical protein